VNRLRKEVENVQNAALGAALLWRFAVGYMSANPSHSAAPLPLLFLVTPIVLHEKTEELVGGTQTSSGLRTFAGKFAKSEHNKQDLLIGINGRAAAMRGLTMDSIRLGLATHLIHLNSAFVIPLSNTPARAGIPASVRRLLGSAEKLGVWCGSLTMHEVATTLKVRF
jgi:hypothetical protein